MDIGDYATNVLCSNNFAIVNYEYLEVLPSQRHSSRKQLRQLEDACRLEGKLVYHDLSRDGLWVFVPSEDGESSSVSASVSSLADSMGIRLVEKEKGTFEPSALGKVRQAPGSSFSGQGPAVSPSTSIDASRFAPTTHSWASQHNTSTGASHEQPLTSPNARLATHMSEQSSSLSYIHELIVCAVLRTIVHQLCRNAGFLPLNSRTLLLPFSSISNDDRVQWGSIMNVAEVLIVTLDVSLTPLGSLVVKARPDIAPYIRDVYHPQQKTFLGNCEIGRHLWLAPGGITARYRGLFNQDSQSQLAEMDSNLWKDLSHFQISAPKFRIMKSEFADWIEEKGLSSKDIEGAVWIYVEAHSNELPYRSVEYHNNLSGEATCIVPWPAFLCFQVASPTVSSDSERNLVSQQSRDPLYFAETWFSEGTERGNALASRLQERRELDDLSKENPDTERRIAQLPASSPVALRRGSNAGAMYPTPPDALHHPLGATPSLDGNVSTPGNTTHCQQPDGGGHSANQMIKNLDVELWGPPSEKKNQASAPDILNDNEDLFGEVTGDFFGTDVTDADFSFFDQPDDNQPQDSTKSINDSRLDSTDTADVEMDLDLPNSILTSALSMNMNEREAKIDATNDHEIIPNDLENLSHNSHNISISQLHPPSRPPEMQLAVREASPAFDKEAVFKRIYSESMDKENKSGLKSAMSFHKMQLQEDLASVDGKYDEHGQFGFRSEKASRMFQHFNPSQLPRTDYLITRRRATEQPEQPVGADKLPFFTISTPEDMDYVTDSDQSSQASGKTVPKAPAEDSRQNWIEGSKIDGIDDLDYGQATSPLDSEQFSHTPQSVLELYMRLPKSSTDDLPLSAYIVAPPPGLAAVGLSDNECIAAAQILADQAVSGILQIPEPSLLDIPDAVTRRSRTVVFLRLLTQVIGECLATFKKCSMRKYLDIQGVPAIQGPRLPPRPIVPQRASSTLDLAKMGNPFVLHGPRLELRRADSTLSVLPSAVDFWDNLGLSPSSGSKDVAAVCVYPNIEGISLLSSTFLDQMRSLYESFRLGTHERLITKELTHGLLPYAVDLSMEDNSKSLGALKETIGRLGRIFAMQSMEERNLVVYFIYPPRDGRLLVQVCSAFQHLFSLYRKALAEKKMSTVNELVLQLVPLSFISSPNSMVVRPATDYSHLAMEVYDRCVDFSSMSSSPAILLEQPLPKMLDFKLSSQPSVALLQENTCLHIAYAQSLDSRWVSAAWTDNKGAKQMTASYCLGRKHEPISVSFNDIAKEIWSTTLDFISNKKIHWRLMVVRIGVMGANEVEIWTRLAGSTSESRLSLTLVTANTEPSLFLLPSSITLIPNSAPVQAVLTPASTPQPTQTTFGTQDNALTPTKDSNNPSTPGEPPAEPEKDAYLVNYTDQSWGAILSHRLNNTNSLLDPNPALVSGYLIKRGGVSAEDSPVLLEVSIVHSDIVGNPRTYHENLLREILGYYRGLGTLARVRGVVDPVVDCRPWHIAAVEKAVRALYILL